MYDRTRDPITVDEIKRIVISGDRSTRGPGHQRWTREAARGREREGVTRDDVIAMLRAYEAELKRGGHHPPHAGRQAHSASCAGGKTARTEDLFVRMHAATTGGHMGPTYWISARIGCGQTPRARVMG